MNLIDNLIHWYYKSNSNVNHSMESSRMVKRVHQHNTPCITKLKPNVKSLSPDTIQSKIKCIACFNASVDVILIPCGHISICKECLDKLDHSVCPVCRAKVKNIHLFYICAWVEPE